MRALPLAALLLLAAPLLAACARDDFSRAGTWQPTGMNERNLQAMLADPADAARGVAAAEERGTAATAPIDRLIRDRRKPLPATISGFGAGAGSPAGAPAPQEGANAR
ncbi:hypothetical protein [Roseomonas indoligenes]|uniref:DUF3035 domain-containing protein n=1 Tax=Roseomonas indoligenes TaxID=2820811 RepID=A0A940N0K7_9PROT|nr:hypothetical protein [Pararoseomonas indoligenes]MBP0493876.1 hypothetical protein [Pararoseomonas indoligenes]